MIFETLSLADNDFIVLNLPLQYDLDLTTLQIHWKKAIATTHPDRFIQTCESEKRLAMQWSTRFNEAYQRLKHPLKRASYVCELIGYPINAEHNTAMPSSFLMQQIELREALEDATNLDALNQLLNTLKGLQTQLYTNLSQLLFDLSNADNLHRATQCIRSLMFFDKFNRDVQQHITRFVTP